MSIILYADQAGVYNLLDYKRSHSELLLRKRKDGVNIDIVFKSTQVLLLPTTIQGVEISVIGENNLPRFLRESYYFSQEYGYKLYCIKDNAGKLFYLNGGVFGVFKNELDILESSLGDFMWSSNNELLFWSVENI